MSARPELSVVIVTYNARSLIADCLDSLYAECDGIVVEVFVVDCASHDGTADFVRATYPGVRVVASASNLGFSAGNNAALPLCEGRFIALLNPDTVVQNGSMRRLMAVLDADDTIGAAGPMLVLRDCSTQLESVRNLPTLGNMWPWLALLDKLQHAVRDRGRRASVAAPPPRPRVLDGFNLLWWERDASCDAACLSGACMVMRRGVVERIGLLDDACPLYLDDMDYCKRIGDAGWRLRFVHDARVTHLWEASTATLRRQSDFYGMQCHAVWLYLRKHRGSIHAAVFAAMALLSVVFRGVVCVVCALLTRGAVRSEWRRRLAMTLGLLRWAARVPKRAPRFGFACERGADRV
jgi:hypothetical protein